MNLYTHYSEWAIVVPKEYGDQFDTVFRDYLDRHHCVIDSAAVKSPVGKRETRSYAFNVDKYETSKIENALTRAFTALPDEITLTLTRKDWQVWTK